MALRDLVPWKDGSRNLSVQGNETGNPFLALHREMNRMFDEAFRSFDAGMPGVYEVFRLACPALSAQLRPIETGLARLRGAKPFYDDTAEALAATRDDVDERRGFPGSQCTCSSASGASDFSSFSSWTSAIRRLGSRMVSARVDHRARM